MHEFHIKCLFSFLNFKLFQYTNIHTNHIQLTGRPFDTKYNNTARKFYGFTYNPNLHQNPKMGTM